MSHSERSKKFIDSKVQGALAGRLILHWLVFLVVTLVVAFCFEWMINPTQTASQQAEQVWRTYGPLVLVMVFLLPVFVFDSIKLSHRFVGPVFRLRNAIRSIADGESTAPVKFRESDFWQSLAEDFNRMVDCLRVEGIEADGGQRVAESEKSTAIE